MRSEAKKTNSFVLEISIHNLYCMHIQLINGGAMPRNSDIGDAFRAAVQFNQKGYRFLYTRDFI